MTNFCKTCGTQLNTDTGFCPSCGSPITVNNNPTEVSNNMYNQGNMTNQVNTGEKDNTVTAFVLSLLGFLCCTYLAIPGLIMSISSLQKINKGQLAPKNKGLAIAGIVLGALGILTLVINIINMIVNPGANVSDALNEILNA